MFSSSSPSPAAETVLTAEGWEVINLNKLARNFRFADLLAKQGSARLLVQVKGTTTSEGLVFSEPGQLSRGEGGALSPRPRRPEPPPHTFSDRRLAERRTTDRPTRPCSCPNAVSFRRTRQGQYGVRRITVAPRHCLIIDLVVGRGELTDEAWEQIAP
ncbi:hypothetical protein, partial [Streptomyces viridiviolaceus]|uniref:hypothetical protein n=1 Tax=Streptomyces viridiviolaceus TaxID=68282 RepID=UPI001E647B0F